MTTKAVPGRSVGMCRVALGAIAPVVALAVVGHTLAFVLEHHPALPIADGWAPWSSLRQVLDGQAIPAEALVARHNEHRILMTRLLFLLDLLDGGRDRISTAASLAFQALQAGIWLALLRRTEAPPIDALAGRRRGRRHAVHPPPGRQLRLGLPGAVHRRVRPERRDRPPAAAGNGRWRGRRWTVAASPRDRDGRPARPAVHHAQRPAGRPRLRSHGPRHALTRRTGFGPARPLGLDPVRHPRSGAAVRRHAER